MMVMMTPCWCFHQQQRAALGFALLTMLGIFQMDRIEQSVLGRALSSSSQQRQQHTEQENHHHHHQAIVLAVSEKKVTPKGTAGQTNANKNNQPLRAAGMRAAGFDPKGMSHVVERTNNNNNNNDDQQPPKKRAPENYKRGLPPVVLEKYKLIMYSNSKVGKTAWRMLCRKMMGFDDYYLSGGNVKAKDDTGLKYLINDYSKKEQQKMMTDPTWTRALFVRDPKERFLSAYLDKAVNTNFVQNHGCCHGVIETCAKPARESLRGFFDIVTTVCPGDGHWRPQNQVIKPDYWPYVNFVGHMETVSRDAKRLLVRVGAWEEHGKTGWGAYRNESVFAPRPDADGRKHATNAKEKLKAYYTPELEELVEIYYESDYSHPTMNITKMRIFE